MANINDLKLFNYLLLIWNLSSYNKFWVERQISIMMTDLRNLESQITVSKKIKEQEFEALLMCK